MFNDALDRPQRATSTILFQHSPSYSLLRCTFFCFPNNSAPRKNRKPSKLTHRWQEAERSTQYSYIWSHTIMRTNTSKTELLPPRNLTSVPVVVEPCAPPPFLQSWLCSNVGLDFCLPLRRPSYSTLHCGGEGGGEGPGREEDEVKFRGGLSE